MLDAFTELSSEKYVARPAGSPCPEKTTVPLFESTALNDVPGPSYPVGPNGHPSGADRATQRPSPSKAKIGLGPAEDMGNSCTGPLELFRMPTRVSSAPS